MNFSIIHSAQNNVLDSDIIDIEIDISNGLHSFSIIGLGDRAIEESKDRISSALKNSGFISPKKKNQKIIFSLAPANIKKSGPYFDLAMALVYLKSIGEVNFETKNKLFIGELSLDGRLKRINGILPIIITAKKQGFSEIFIPEDNSEEASLIKGIKIFPCKNLNQTISHLQKTKIIIPLKSADIEYLELKSNYNNTKYDDMYVNIIGQNKAKRGLEIAAAGGHNIGFWGPPGTGKTLLSKSIRSLLPSLKYEEIIESTSIYSISGMGENIIKGPPFRNPHHTSSHGSIIGGGSYLKPGEISLAHNGVLFLDEAPEFDKKIIDSLRQPIEDGYINLSRLNQKVTLPSNFILIISMNPCPCGYYKSNIKKCTCSHSSIEKYRKKISGPVIDRIDMWIEVNNIKDNKCELAENTNNEAKIDKYNRLLKTKSNILSARNMQKYRQSEILNSEINYSKINKFCELDSKSENLIKKASDRLNLSIRSYNNIIKLARTIADLESSENILETHILEALQYRPKF